MTLALAGLKEEAAQVSAATAAESSSGPYVLALAARSRFEEAIAALNPSQMIVPGIGYFYYYPVWDPVRNDPRFVKFLTELGVKAAHDRAQAWRMANRTTEGRRRTADGGREMKTFRATDIFRATLNAERSTLK